MYSAIPALGPKGPKRVDGVKLPKSAGTTLSRVAGTAAGFLGSMQGLWSGANQTPSGLDTIQCASFEDIAFDPQMPNHRTPSLIIGYHNGFQIWDMSRAHQESHTIHEVISKQWDASVTIATTVQLFDDVPGEDYYAEERPFLALAASDGKADGLSRGTLHLYSIPKGTFLQIPLQGAEDASITEILTNGSWIAVGTTHHKIYLIDIKTLQVKTAIQCWLDPDTTHPPTFTLGARWLAFQSGTPLNGEIESSVAKKTKKMVDEETTKESKEAKRAAQGAWSQQEVLALGYAGMREAVYLGSQLFTSVMNTYNGEGSTSSGVETSTAPGTVEIWSLSVLRYNQNRSARISLFSADNRRIEKMAFDRPGLILATAADGGQSVKIWNAAHIVASLSPNTPFNPMYILERGTTLGTISSMSFTEDSSLIAFTTKPKGTTHIFPMSLVGQEVGIATHLPSNIPETQPLGEPACNALKPSKLAAIHSVANSSAIFPGVSRLGSFPLRPSHTDQKRAAHAHDRTLYSFYPNGSLIRQDLVFKSDATTIPASLAMLTIQRYKWDLCRSTTGSLQFPTFTPNNEQLDHVYGMNPNGPVSAPDASELLANVETQTHALSMAEGGSSSSGGGGGSSDMGVPLPKFVIHAYTELPPAVAREDASKAWRNDDFYSSLASSKLHSPGLPGGVNKPLVGAQPQQPHGVAVGAVLPIMMPKLPAANAAPPANALPPAPAAALPPQNQPHHHQPQHQQPAAANRGAASPNPAAVAPPPIPSIAVGGSAAAREAPAARESPAARKEPVQIIIGSPSSPSSSSPSAAAAASSSNSNSAQKQQKQQEPVAAPSQPPALADPRPSVSIKAPVSSPAERQLEKDVLAAAEAALAPLPAKRDHLPMVAPEPSSPNSHSSNKSDPHHDSSSSSSSPRQASPSAAPSWAAVAAPSQPASQSLAIPAIPSPDYESDGYDAKPPLAAVLAEQAAPSAAPGGGKKRKKRGSQLN